MKKKPAYSLLMYIVVFFVLPFLVSLIALTINYTAGMVSFILSACWYAFLWWLYTDFSKNDNPKDPDDPNNYYQ